MEPCLRHVRLVQTLISFNSALTLMRGGNEKGGAEQWQAPSAILSEVCSSNSFGFTQMKRNGIKLLVKLTICVYLQIYPLAHQLDSKNPSKN